MKLKTKILLGYGVAIAMMAAVSGWSISNLVSLGRASNAILRENYRSIISAENMVNALERMDSSTLLILMGETAEGTRVHMESEMVFLEWLGRACDNVTIQGESTVVEAIRIGFSAYREAFQRLSREVAGHDFAPRKVLGAYKSGIFNQFSEVRDLCLDLRRLNEATMYDASEKAGLVASRAFWSTSIAAGAASLGSLLFSLLLAERLTGPIRRFMEASRKISSGDYSVRVPVETNDELGSLAREFNQMTEHLGRYHEMNIDQLIAEKSKGDAILSSISDGMVVFDTQMNVMGINPAARRIFDLEFVDCFSIDYDRIFMGSRIFSEVLRAMEAPVGSACTDEERIFTRSDESGERHYFFSVTRIRGRDRDSAGVVLLLRDVTRLKEVERLKSEFVMAASHELRTPLTSLGMSVDLLLEHVAPGLQERERGLLEAAHEEVHRMKALVNDLLDLSKLEAGKIDIEFDRVAVYKLFEHVREVFGNQLEMKGITLVYEKNQDLMIRADANKITWVLTNLVSNALRYVPSSGHIEISAFRFGEAVHIGVKDDGPGIPQEYQSRIFEKFVQVKGALSGGTGLGLAICKEIIRAHGGTIWVESGYGKGSTFTFTVPAAV